MPDPVYLDFEQAYYGESVKHTLTIGVLMAAGKNRKGIQPHGSRRADGEAKPICQPPPPQQ